MKPLFAILPVLLFAACSPSEQTTLTSTTTHQALAVDSEQLKYAKTSTEEGRNTVLSQMLGTWYVHTMQRQGSMPEETVNLYLNLNEDQTFIANTTCGALKGAFSVNGSSISFSSVSYNRNDCGNAAQLDEMVRLLTQHVGIFAFNGNMLFLKDKQGNNVFRITR